MLVAQSVKCANDSSVAAASCFINLVIKESDNNVKLIVLDRLETLRAKHDHVLDGLIMDVLQVLSHRFVLVQIPPAVHPLHVSFHLQYRH